MKVKKILLLDSPFVHFMGETQPSVPLGLAYLAAVLLKLDLEVAVYNTDLEHRSVVIESGKRFFDEISAFNQYRDAITNTEHYLYK
ncbi:MAG: hypothetical protein WCI77_03370 [Candidatus Omnitrophota bacterium]